MAIISIPTSIGGVSIPGALINGPLGALFGNLFGFDFLQYPRDLSSATKGHVIQFSVNEIQPITYEEATTFLGDFTSVEGAFKNFNSVSDFFTGNSQKTLNFKPKKKRKVATVSLYIPDTMNFQYNSGYSSTNLLEIANEVASAAGAGSRKPILGTLGKYASLGLSAVQSNAAKLALSTQGLAINPQQQLLFQGIDFRTYQMAFTFTPYSAQEAETVRKIVELFKYHAAPQITTSGSGMFFVPPSTFDLDFLFNGIPNKNVNRVAESVIESIDVNYAPNGWSAHDNGAPVQTTLTINFKEIELIDKDKIKEGY